MAGDTQSISVCSVVSLNVMLEMNTDQQFLLPSYCRYGMLRWDCHLLVLRVLSLGQRDSGSVICPGTLCRTSTGPCHSAAPY